MKSFQFELRAAPGSIYSPSRQVTSLKERKEGPEDFDKRTWREHAWTDENNGVVMPGIGIHKMLTGAAISTGKKVAGRGAKRYSSLLPGGLMIQDMPLGIALDELRSIRVSCQATPSKGEKGGRVPRIFPTIPDWQGIGIGHILNDDIALDVLRDFFIEGGQLVGLGRWRPEKGGYNGRFLLVRLVEIEALAAAA